METPVSKDSTQAMGADPKMSQYLHRQTPISFHFKTTEKQNDPPNYPPADPMQSNTGRSRDNSGRKGSISGKVNEVRTADHEKAKLYRDQKGSTKPLSSATCNQEEVSRESEEDL